MIDETVGTVVVANPAKLLYEVIVLLAAVWLTITYTLPLAVEAVGKVIVGVPPVIITVKWLAVRVRLVDVVVIGKAKAAPNVAPPVSVLAPVTANVLESEVAPVTPNVLDKVAAPPTDKLPDKADEPATDKAPPIVPLPPTLKLAPACAELLLLI